MPHILLLGTLDTKHAEVLYLHTQLQQTSTHLSQKTKITLIDCGCRSTSTDPRISITRNDLVTTYSPEDAPPQETLDSDRGAAIKHIATCATRCIKHLLSTTKVHAILGTGGSGGTSLISAVMRDAAPIGLPKMIASTVASGNTGPVVGECDITLMYSVVDIAGSNRLLHEVLGNAAGAALGMAVAYEARLAESQKLVNSEGKGKEEKIRVGVTMFGVTTPCVDRVRCHLEEKYPVEVYVFHATGHGGKAMERLVREGRLDAILDITTTEICDFIAGGEMSCDDTRLETTLRRGVPNIISVGATDMVNFGPRDTVPPRYRERNLFVHNPSVTLMRTSAEECRRVGQFIVDKVGRLAKDPEMVEVWIPEGGVSIIATKGGPFADSAADKLLADTIRSGLEGTQIRVVSDERAVNDDGFAVDIADRLMALVYDSEAFRSKRKEAYIYAV
ncbi:hypothetical protein BJX76DRAFT_344034 [Aspergillus varians]